MTQSELTTRIQKKIDFGDCIVNGKGLHPVEDALNAKKLELNLNGEIKWTKVTANYLEKYIKVIDLFFDFFAESKIKVRILFRKMKNAYEKTYRYYRSF